MEKLIKNSEWLVAGGLLLLVFNYIYEPANNCISGIWVSDSCPDKDLTFISVALIVLGLALVYKKNKDKNHVLPKEEVEEKK